MVPAVLILPPLLGNLLIESVTKSVTSMLPSTNDCLCIRDDMCETNGRFAFMDGHLDWKYLIQCGRCVFAVKTKNILWTDVGESALVFSSKLEPLHLFCTIFGVDIKALPVITSARDWSFCLATWMV